MSDLRCVSLPLMSCREIKVQTQRRNVGRSGLPSERRCQRVWDICRGKRHRSIFTRTSSAFDANALSHDISTPGFLRCTAAPHEWTVGMWRPVCANSHIALVRVDPVEQSLRSHPFHGQTTLQQQNRIGQQNHSVQSSKTWTQKHRLSFILQVYRVYNLHSLHKYNSKGFITAANSGVVLGYRSYHNVCCLSWSWIQQIIMPRFF